MSISWHFSSFYSLAWFLKRAIAHLNSRFWFLWVVSVNDYHLKIDQRGGTKSKSRKIVNRLVYRDMKKSPQQGWSHRWVLFAVIRKFFAPTKDHETQRNNGKVILCCEMVSNLCLRIWGGRKTSTSYVSFYHVPNFIAGSYQMRRRDFFWYHCTSN